MEKLMEMGRDASVQIACHPAYLHDGQRLEPAQWEALRVEMQKRYRRATGEEFAVLTVDNNPREAA